MSGGRGDRALFSPLGGSSGGLDSSFGTPSAEERARIEAVLGVLPHAAFVMTSGYEDASAGVRVLSVCRCAVEPSLVAVSVRKGHAIEPLIRDSRAFVLNAVRAEDRLLLRKFPPDGGASSEDDPLDALVGGSLRTGAPLLTRAVSALDCEVVRHFDLEADHELYVGLVVAARAPEAAVRAAGAGAAPETRPEPGSGPRPGPEPGAEARSVEPEAGV